MPESMNKIALTHECFENAIFAINASGTIEELITAIPSVLPIRMASYHHFAAVGSFDFKGLSQYYAYKIPEIILDYLNTHNQHKKYPGVEATFSKGQPIWLSELSHEPVVIEAGHVELIHKSIAITGDGLCVPLYGPKNRYGYMFVAFGMSKSECRSILPFQVQALAQKLHVRYCLMLEKLHKHVKLTQREAEVLELISFGKTNKDIGMILNISSNTVAGYVKQIFLKLEVSDRVSAAMRAQTIKVSL